jgi:hypothetical protein
VVLVNIFYGKNNGVQKVDFLIIEFFPIRSFFFSQGFGFTLKGKSDFLLHKFLAGSPETFDPYYGVKDYDGDGDIFKSENIDALQNYVYKCTMNYGVHIVMADGVRFEKIKISFFLNYTFRDFLWKDKKIFKKF